MIPISLGALGIIIGVSVLVLLIFGRVVLINRPSDENVLKYFKPQKRLGIWLDLRSGADNLALEEMKDVHRYLFLQRVYVILNIIFILFCLLGSLIFKIHI